MHFSLKHKYIRIGGGYRHSFLFVRAMLEEIELRVSVLPPKLSPGVVGVSVILKSLIFTLFISTTETTRTGEITTA